MAAICAQLPSGSGKLVPKRNLHITLAFLGPLETGVVNNLRRDAASIKTAAFTLQLDQLGWWRQPRVAWLGAADNPRTLLDLVAAVNKMLMTHGLRPDDRPYQAHLTIARKVTKNPGEFTFDPILWPVSSFALVQSRTLPAGAEYEVIATWPLSSR